METDMMQEEVVAVTEEAPDISQLCRVCANPNEYLIPIFHGEGLEHDLKSKVSQHLPIQIRESDSLPVQLCYQCASTLIAWSDLVEGCSEADEKLRSMLPEGVQCEVILDTRKDLPSTSGKQFHPQISSVTSGALFKNQEEIAASAEVVEEQEVTTMDQDAEAIEPAQQRSGNSKQDLSPKKVDLRKKNLNAGGSMFCVYCGQMKTSFSALVKHMSINHKADYEHCPTRFVGRSDQKNHLVIHQSLPNEEERLKKQVKPVVVKVPTNDLRAQRRPTRFVDRSNQKNHLVIHQSKTPNKEERLTNQVKPEVVKIRTNDLRAQHPGNPPKAENSKIEVETVIVPPNTAGEPEMHDDFSWPLANESHDMKNNPLANESHDMKNNPTLKRKRTKRSSINNAVNNQITCEKCGRTDKNMKSHKLHMYWYHIKGDGPMTIEDRKGLNVIDYPIIQKGRVVTDTGIVYKCYLCEKIVTTKEVYLRHVRSHTGENPYKCEHCEREFPVKTSLKSHSCPAVEPIKRFTCDVCGDQFKRNEQMKRHMRNHTGETPYSCEYCGKKFRLSHSLWLHLRIHRDIRLFQCETCGLRCLTRGHLNRHVRTHTGEKPFVCDTCGQGFSVRLLLREHIQVHHIGVKIHACELCPRSYHLRRNLLRHMKTHTAQVQEEAMDYVPQ